jgi:hypothetical protein
LCLQNFPIHFSYGVFRFKKEIVEPDNKKRKDKGPENVASPQLTQHEIRTDTIPAAAPEEDSPTEETSQADEDILREAFDVINAPEEEFEDEEDEIVWDPR